MQWLLFVISLVAMAVFQRLTRAAPLEARATLAFGFLIFTAHVAGTIAQRSPLRLPRISGYLLAGFLVGPWLGLVREAEVAALAIFADGALALIALAVGVSLPFRALWDDRRPLLRIVTGASLFPFAVVTLVVLTISPWFPLTAHQPFRDAVVIALVLGTFAVVSSPVVAGATIDDLGARGPLAHGIPGVALALDVIAALLLVAVIALAQPIASWGAATPGVALVALLRLTGSVAVGILLGLAVAQYVRVVRDRLVLLLAALAAIVALAVRGAGLEGALLGLAAGCTLRAAAPAEGERVKSALDKCAVPIHVVFFGLLGAGLRLGTLAQVWPWVLLLLGLRVTGLRAGARWASTGSDHGWLGLIPQGGLAITLAAIARRAFPEWNVSLESLLVTLVGVQLVAGPICLLWALRRSGELREEEDAKTLVPVAGGSSL
jgi:Kef-type K+ transport system membrane component KefB